MPPKAPKPQQTGISAFLRRLEKPVSELQRFLAEYPDHEAQFLEHEKTHAQQEELARSLAAQQARTTQLEAAVAVFEGVHMDSSKALKAENGRLEERLARAEARVVQAERELEGARVAQREVVESGARERRQDVEKAARELAAALDRQRARFEKQHSDTVDSSMAQLARVASDMERQAAEMEKLELINEGLKDRASKLKELQQEFSNIPDDVLYDSLLLLLLLPPPPLLPSDTD